MNARESQVAHLVEFEYASLHPINLYYPVICARFVRNALKTQV